MKIVVKNILVVLVFSCSLYGAETTKVEVNEKVQEVILQVAAATGGQTDFQEKANEFEHLMSGNRTNLCRQLLIFMTTKHDTANLPNHAGWGVIALFKKMNFTAQERLAAVTPLMDAGWLTLEGPDDEEMGRQFLRDIDKGHKKQKPDFQLYKDLLNKRKQNPPGWLAQHMYESAPTAALTTLAEVYLNPEQAKALVDQVKSEDDAQSVDRLSKRPEWWAKLYAAEKMNQNPKLRDPELIKQLKKSNNPVVNATVQEIEDEKK